MKKLIMAAALAAVSAPALSQAPAPRPDADPALWSIRDHDTVIYLFGTFHLLDGRQDWFNDEVRRAFDSSSELVLEFVPPENPAAIQPLLMRYAADPSGRPLAERLPAELAARLRQTLAEMGLPANAYDRLEPWFVAMALVSAGAQRIGITGEHGTETTLSAAARARGMPVSGVETLEGQLAMLDALPVPLQIEQLALTIAEMGRLQETFGPMITAWGAGDVERLFTIMHGHMARAPALYRALMVDRNAAWARWIRERMARPGTVFLAVGAGHLAGGDSVQAMLAQQGIRAVRVPHQGD